MQAVSSADMIIVMDKGHPKWVGSSADFSFSSYMASSPLNELDADLHSQGQSSGTNSSSELKELSLPDRDSMLALDGGEEIIEAELRKEGKVELKVYKLV